MTKTRIAALEAALATSWDREHLAVYADALQAAGDPRGELIAIDLHIEALGTTPELDARRRELVTTWLGNLPTSSPITASFGFVEVTARTKQVLRDAAGSHFAAWIRSVTLQGEPELLADGVAVLSIRRWPWLSRISIARWSAKTTGLAIANNVVAALTRATPSLELLEVSGTCVMDELGHPALRRLRVSDQSTIAGLVGDGPAFPRVAELDYAFWDNSTPRPATRASVLRRLDLRPERWPSLRRLDLSDNELGESNRRPDREVDVFRILSDLPIGPQLTHVRMPSLRNDADALHAQQALDRMTALEELSIARVLGTNPRLLRHRSAKLLVPEPTPWPRCEDVGSRDALDIDVDGVEQLDVSSAVELMESSYTGLTEEGRAAWDQLWTALASYGWTEEVRLRFPAAVLLVALEAVELGDEEFRWRDLRTALRVAKPSPTAIVRIRRSWGW